MGLAHLERVPLQPVATALAVALLAIGPAARAQTPSYAKDIAPMLNSRCAGCHEAKVKMGSLDIDFSSRQW